MKALEEALAELGVAYEAAEVETFRKYMELVLLRNEHMNLTAITDPELFAVKHFADSVLCAGWPEIAAARAIVDIGTGAGFPGVPLAILLPDRDFTLIDSSGKRARFLEEILPELGLSNVRVICGRAEDLARDASLRGAFDLCVSRAVARLSVLAEYCLPFLAVGGFMFAYKGDDVEGEVSEARRAFSLLGGEPREVRRASLGPRGPRHSIVIAEKTKETPPRYPRRAGAPARRPL